MKSGKQRRIEIMARRRERHAVKATANARLKAPEIPKNSVAVNGGRLNNGNSYGVPDFVQRGYYTDLSFFCKDCGAFEIWTAAQQKWWYEVARGLTQTTAVRCQACRVKERARKAAARVTHLTSLKLKKAAVAQV